MWIDTDKINGLTSEKVANIFVKRILRIRNEMKASNKAFFYFRFSLEFGSHVKVSC